MGLTKHFGGNRVHDATVVTMLALLLRLVVVVWAYARFPPAGDGQYYHVVAGRIAQGLGYTWQWPDGAITYAAHYPVGYPAILGGLYALFGSRPVLAMLLNAVGGTFIAWAVHRVGNQLAGRRVALTAGILAAVFPTYVFYTPAMMTELVSAALCMGSVVLALHSARRRVVPWGALIGIAVILGVAALIRPQQLIFAPFFGFLVIAYGNKMHPRPSTEREQFPLWRALGAGVLVTCLGGAVCLPWTLRNCTRMGQCVFVSANAGWNLLIGTSAKGGGAWVSVDAIGVPPECRLVFAEAAKDACFRRAAARTILAHPVEWLRLVPKKLERTFDDVGAPGWYLSASAPQHFGGRAKLVLGVVEVLTNRLVMLAAFVGLLRLPGNGRWVRVPLAVAGAGCLLYTYAWLGVLLLSIGILSLGRDLLKEPILLLLCFGYGSTAAIHAVFFGGARYALVVMPFMLLAAARTFAPGGSGAPARAMP